MNELESQLHDLLPKERVKARLIDRYAYAGDASHFYLVPKAVIQPVSIEEVKKIFEFSHREKINITFRAGGTSLSGQGVTDGILVDLSNYWRKVVPENDGATLRVEPAVIGANANHALKKYSRKIGPDPASISAAMMGGILSNNSSGMCCGVVQNSYHTMRSMTFVLPNGMVFNSELTEDYHRFENEAPHIADGLRALRVEILNNQDLVNRIRKKYMQKNTVGYCMNAFIDFEHPLDILTHLIIGSEGTLAFIAEAVMNTVPDLPHKITGMLYFQDPVIACNAIWDLKSTGAEALEFMDRASLQSVENMPGVPALLKDLPSQACSILCEFQESNAASLSEKFERARPIIEKLPLILQPNFTQDPKEQAIMWKIRKGMYPSVAGMRARGTSALMEDFTFPVERLGEAVLDVQYLFDKYNYENGIIFGHAKDGNLHFVISQSFGSDEEIRRYEKFNDDLFDLILNKYDGALKAEHSSGRAVSAYIEKEWGGHAYDIMKRLKNLIDPDNLLNPGIIITEDKLTHIHHLKVMPVVEEEVDKCIECGFCEQSCPSRDLTLTPRRRIVVRRAMKRLQESGEKSIHKTLLKEFNYDGLETCAVDGMCATNCPVDINTGDLIKRLRKENHSVLQNKLAVWIAKHFFLFENISKLGIRSGFLFNRVFGNRFMKRSTAAFRTVLPFMPVWSNEIRMPAKKIKGVENGKEDQKAIYFSNCVSRMMGGNAPELFLSVCKKASIDVIVPEALHGMCCGQIFSSKGYSDAYRMMANRSIEKLWESTNEGSIPVVLDVSSCTQTMKSCRNYLTDENQVKFDRMKILDGIDFAAETILSRLKIVRQKDSVVFHPVCSVYKLGSLGSLQRIGNACAKRADIPFFAKCCGMAGDRGFYFPDLTASATKPESDEVRKVSYDGYYSSSRTCEMALSEAVGKSYDSIFKLLDDVSES